MGKGIYARFKGHENAAGPVRVYGPDGKLKDTIWPGAVRKKRRKHEKLSKADNRIHQFRNRLVKCSTSAEDILHEALGKRIKELGWGRKKVQLKFQNIITCRGGSQYIVDFFVSRVGLCIEVDGGYHETEEQIWKDKGRTLALERQGFTVIRFKNEEVFQDVDAVVGKIIEFIKKMRWSR